MEIRTCENCGCKWVFAEEDDSCTYCAGVKVFKEYAEKFQAACEHIGYLTEMVELHSMLRGRLNTKVERYLQDRLEDVEDEFKTFMENDET